MVFAVALNELFGNVERDLFSNYIIHSCIWVQQSLGPLYSVHSIIEMRERKDWALFTSQQGIYSLPFLSSLFMFIANASRENILLRSGGSSLVKDHVIINNYSNLFLFFLLHEI